MQPKKQPAFRITKAEGPRYWRDFQKGMEVTGGEIGGYIFARQELNRRRAEKDKRAKKAKATKAKAKRALKRKRKN